MRRFIALIVATFALCVPIYAQRTITPEDKAVTAEIGKKYPKHKIYYYDEYGVYMLKEKVTPKKPKFSDYDKYSLLDSNGNEIFPDCYLIKFFLGLRTDLTITTIHILRLTLKSMFGLFRSMGVG